MMLTLDRPLTATPLAARLAAAAQQARHSGAPVLVMYSESLPAPDPLTVFAHGAHLAATRVYWASPRQDLVLVGVGAAHEFTARGPARFATLAAEWSVVSSQWSEESDQWAVTSDQEHGAHTLPDGPVLLGGFAFDPAGPTTEAWGDFPAGLLILPRFLLAVTPDAATLTIAVVVTPTTDPDAEAVRLQSERDLLLAADATQHATRNTQQRLRNPQSAIRIHDVRPAAAWKAAVAASAADIRAGRLEKVVLAREVLVDTNTALDPATILRRLQAGYPDCYGFAIARGSRCFLGATPERLVRVQDGTVQATCLAGTTRRDPDPAEDARLGAALLASTKNREEHAVVVRMLADALRAVCSEIEMPDAPTLLRVRNVQHLYTPIAGRLRNGTHLLDLIARLHPTPAVGGLPRAAALAHIAACEAMDRGWYAGPVGWVDSRGDGEFAVALRSALVQGSQARAFAGCGIMGDSDPDAEYAETLVKLRAILSALDEARA